MRQGDWMLIFFRRREVWKLLPSTNSNHLPCFVIVRVKLKAKLKCERSTILWIKDMDSKLLVWLISFTVANILISAFIGPPLRRPSTSDIPSPSASSGKWLAGNKPVNQENTKKNTARATWNFNEVIMSKKRWNVFSVPLKIFILFFILRKKVCTR